MYDFILKEKGHRVCKSRDLRKQNKIIPQLFMFFFLLFNQGWRKQVGRIGKYPPNIFGRKGQDSLFLTISTVAYVVFAHTAIPYRASTGPEQGFPCVLFPHREKPVFVTGMGLQCTKSPGGSTGPFNSIDREAWKRLFYDFTVRNFM